MNLLLSKKTIELYLTVKKTVIQNRVHILGVLFLCILVVLIIGPIDIHQVSAQSLGQQAGTVPPTPEGDNIIVIGIKSIFASMFYGFMMFSAWILSLSGILLNVVLDFTVVKMAINLESTTGINVAWSVIRDLANISFIFVLLYAAIKTILGEGGDMKKTITSIVIAAVLINFSLLFTKLIVDASNIATLTFYNQIVKADQTTQPGSKEYIGLSNSIMQPLGITTLYNPLKGGVDILKSLHGDMTRVIILAVGSSIFMFTVAGIFFSVIGLFVVRYISIMFLLILSPIAVMGSILPQTKGYSADWWKRLTAEATFAPVFMVMMWVVTVIIRSKSFACSSGASQNSIADLFSYVSNSIDQTTVTSTCTVGPYGMVMNFVIAMVLVGAALTVARQTAGHAGTVGQKVTSGLTGVGFGAVGWAGRKTIGRGATAITNSKWLNNAASKTGDYKKNGVIGGLKGTFTGIAGRAAIKQTGTAAKSSYNPSSMLGFDKPKNTRSYKDELDAKKKDIKGYKDQVKEIEDKEKQNEIKKTIDAGVAAHEDKIALDAARAAVEYDKLHTGANTATQAQKDLVDASIKMEDIIGKMTNKQVEALVEGNKKLVEKQAFVDAISSQHMDHLVNKTDKISDEDKNKLVGVRFKKLTEIRSKPDAVRETEFANLGSEIRGYSTNELEMLPPELLADPKFVAQLQGTQVKNVVNSSRFTKSQQTSIRDSRNKILLDSVTAGNFDQTRKIASSMDALELARLANIASSVPGTPSPGLIAITDVGVLSALTTDKLKLMAIELDQPAIQAIRNEYETLNTQLTGSSNGTTITPAGLTASGLRQPEAQKIVKINEWLTQKDGATLFA